MEIQEKLPSAHSTTQIVVCHSERQTNNDFNRFSFVLLKLSVRLQSVDNK
jgi:hypothetical protein